MYQVVHVVYDKLDCYSINGNVEFDLPNGCNHCVSNIDSLIQFCNTVLYNDGMAAPFSEDGFRIDLSGSQAKGYDIEVTVGGSTIIIGNLAVSDLLNDIKRCCMAAIDFCNVRHATVRYKEVGDGDQD